MVGLHAVLRVRQSGGSLWRVYATAQHEKRDLGDWLGETRSEHDKSLANVAFNVLLLDSDHVETLGLRDWAALTDGHDVTDSGTGEGWRQMSGHVVVSLLEPVVFLDVVQVITAEDDSLGHLVGEHDTPISG